MPQDIRISPDGKLFYIADMVADGVHVVDGASFKQIGFIPTGVGAHGLYPSRDGKLLYVANRGTNKMMVRAGTAKGSVSVIDFASRKVVKAWPIPGGGSARHGQRQRRRQIPVAERPLRRCGLSLRDHHRRGRQGQGRREPHGLTVWPQPGVIRWATPAICAEIPPPRISCRRDLMQPAVRGSTRTPSPPTRPMESSCCAAVFTDWVEPQRAGIARLMADPARSSARCSRPTAARRSSRTCATGSAFPSSPAFVMIRGRRARRGADALAHRALVPRSCAGQAGGHQHGDALASRPALLLRRRPAERELLDSARSDSARHGDGMHPRLASLGQGFRPMRFNGTRLYAEDDFEEMPDLEAMRPKLDIAAWDMQPGDAIAFNFRTLHTAPGNRSARRAGCSRRAGSATTPSSPGARARPRRRSGTSPSRMERRSTRRSSRHPSVLRHSDREGSSRGSDARRFLQARQVQPVLAGQAMALS
jgi:hypothetical protein